MVFSQFSSFKPPELRSRYPGTHHCALSCIGVLCMLCVHGSRADYFDFKTNQDSVTHSFTHPDQGASGEKKSSPILASSTCAYVTVTIFTYVYIQDCFPNKRAGKT